MTKSNFKKISYDVISVTSSLFRHRIKRHKTNVSRFFDFGPFPIKNFPVPFLAPGTWHGM